MERFTISLDEALAKQFDDLIAARGYSNRSEAIRDLIRNDLLIKQWKEGGIVAGIIMITYSHHKIELVSKILDIQHDYQELVISTQHIHLTHHDCLEVIITKGEARQIEELASRLKALVGVKHLNLSISAVGDN